MLILLVPLTLICYIKNLKLLAPFSTLANIMTFFGISIILYFVFQDLPSFEERKMSNDLYNFSLYIGIALFALQSTGVVRFKLILLL